MNLAELPFVIRMYLENIDFLNQEKKEILTKYTKEYFSDKYLDVWENADIRHILETALLAKERIDELMNNTDFCQAVWSSITKYYNAELGVNWDVLNYVVKAKLLEYQNENRKT